MDFIQAGYGENALRDGPQYMISKGNIVQSGWPARTVPTTGDIDGSVLGQWLSHEEEEESRTLLLFPLKLQL
ncbi:hypothetical protein AB1N83_013367 [Pleurotus pulmonarius]